MNISRRLWFSRLLIGLVAAWNLQAALAFMLWPEQFAPGFELSGLAGSVAVRGTGILFLMWNVPYLVALWNPHKQRMALIMAIVMQTIGLFGETWIYLLLGAGHGLLQTSIFRFIAFDGSGLVLLITAFWLVKNSKK